MKRATLFLCMIQKMIYRNRKFNSNCFQGMTGHFVPSCLRQGHCIHIVGDGRGTQYPPEPPRNALMSSYSLFLNVRVSCSCFSRSWVFWRFRSSSDFSNSSFFSMRSSSAEGIFFSILSSSSLRANIAGTVSTISSRSFLLRAITTGIVSFICLRSF